MIWSKVQAWSTPEQLLAVLFVLWWGVAVMGQMRASVVSRMRAYDVFELIPAYRFFAPVPRFTEHLLELRTDDASWTAVSTSFPRGWRSAFWNPEKRFATAFHLTAGRLLTHGKHQGMASAKQSLAYLQMLSIVETIALVRTSLPPSRVQFRLVNVSDSPAHVVFCSDWHALPR